MQRKRNGTTLSFWQWSLLCVLELGGLVREINHPLDKKRTLFITRFGSDSREFWTNPVTMKSLQDRGLIKRLKHKTWTLNAAGRDAVGALTAEEIEGFFHGWAMHDIRERVDKATGERLGRHLLSRYSQEEIEA